MAFESNAKKRASIIAGLLIAGVSTTTFAQSPAKTGPAAAENSGGLEEIVVTARKTEDKASGHPADGIGVL